MKFSLEIDSNNAAMVEDGAGEVCRILRVIRERIYNGARDGILRDVNGNQVGSWAMEEPEKEPE